MNVKKLISVLPALLFSMIVVKPALAASGQFNFLCTISEELQKNADMMLLIAFGAALATVIASIILLFFRQVGWTITIFSLGSLFSAVLYKSPDVLKGVAQKMGAAC